MKDIHFTLGLVFIVFAVGQIALAADSPATVLGDGAALVAAKSSIAAGTSPLAGNAAQVVRDADKCLGDAPYSVMRKEAIPPSGDKHDYASLAPYWWPDPSKPGGLPYVRRDGQYNPERSKYDLDDMDKMSEGSYITAMAYFFTGEQKYADRSAALMRTWFLSPDTRMNPNVRYAQFRPGSASEGVPSGVLETTRLFRVLDADALLAGSSAWSAADHAALKQWFIDYVKYLQTSEQGKAEGAAANNHGTWYAVQVSSYLIYLDRRDEAKALIDERFHRFMDTQIEADGTQPKELDRTRSLHYSRFNLQALMELGRLGDRVGLDLWDYKNPKGASLQTALDWLLPRFIDPKNSDQKDIGHLQQRDLAPILRTAVLKFKDPKYLKLLLSLDGYNAKTDRGELLWSKPAE